nr:AAA family ATPase [Cellulomonas flavigena]
MTSSGEPGIVIREAEIEHFGSEDDLIETFASDRAILRTATGADQAHLGVHGVQAISSIRQWWSSPHARHLVGGYFAIHADTESRLEASKPAPSMDLYENSPSHPLHHVYANPELETRLNDISRRAFNSGLILDAWSGGNQWAFRVGNIDPPDSPRPSVAYLDELRKAPLLHQVGDGVRSMLGLLLRFYTGHQNISLIDEPEAFLHPPQARYIARLLADEAATTERSILVGTHSTEIVHGVLESSASATLVRLSRNRTINNAAVLDNDAVRKLWSDPLLRYSNLLDGLFTDAVIVCEADADCKYFAAVRDTFEDEAVESRRPDILFTSCGGKHKMHAAVEALVAASVPVAVICDFDTLNEWATLRRLFVSAGGDPGLIETDWKILNAALTSGDRNPSKMGVKESLDRSFDAIEEPELTRKNIESLRRVLRIENGWDRVKNSGKSAVPAGDPYRACERIIAALADRRIHLVPVGEMEDLVPAVGGHGAAWVAEVLEQGLHNSPDSDGARVLMRAVLDSLDRGDADAVVEEGADA